MLTAAYIFKAIFIEATNRNSPYIYTTVRTTIDNAAFLESLVVVAIAHFLLVFCFAVSSHPKEKSVAICLQN